MSLYIPVAGLFIVTFIHWHQLRLLRRELEEAREEIRAVARQASRIDARTEHLVEITDRDTGF